ncbi:hypothetical protein ZWY2020_012844 [Hordeum vulgare]|nr:hypothetical protein ZWY2020_012844 [Hordeum vulgare]
MHLSMFAVNGGHGFVGAAQCLELIRRGALEVCSLGLHNSSSWSQQLLDVGVHFFQGSYWFEPYKPVDRSGGVESEAPDRETPRRVRLDSDAPPEIEYYDVYHEFDVKMLHPVRDDQLQVFSARFNDFFGKCQGNVSFLHGISTQNGMLCYFLTETCCWVACE